MRYRRFGRVGWDVSEIGHGLWGMSGWSGSEDRESLDSMRLSTSLGCNFFDTAWAYGNGHSDQLAGQILTEHSGSRLYVASKVPPKNGKWPALSEYAYRDVFPRDHVVEHAEKIRDALNVKRIDLLQFHVWSDAWTNEREFHSTLAELRERGLIEAFGLSLNRWEPENGIEALRTGLVDAVQVIYNVFDQAPEDKLFPVCRELNIAVIARVPLDEGSLSGHLTLDTRFPAGDWRSMYFGSENLRATVERVEKLKAILPAGMTLPEMAFRFIVSNPDVSTTIPGMRKPNHVRDNMSYSDKGALPEELLRHLRKHRWDRRPAHWSA
jgi:aryl-alcohol dehydrogenase-like predicted oxidoreductase